MIRVQNVSGRDLIIVIVVVLALRADVDLRREIGLFGFQSVANQLSYRLLRPLFQLLQLLGDVPFEIPVGLAGSQSRDVQFLNDDPRLSRLQLVLDFGVDVSGFGRLEGGVLKHLIRRFVAAEYGFGDFAIPVRFVDTTATFLLFFLECLEEEMKVGKVFMVIFLNPRRSPTRNVFE